MTLDSVLDIFALTFMALYLCLVIGGAVLIHAARKALPDGTPMHSTKPQARVQTGPYRWCRHPMYLGNTMLITGCGGLGGGILVAWAFFLLSVTVFGEWAAREDTL